MKTNTIFNQRLCGYLMMKGFILVDMKPNNNGSGKNVFYFKESEELLNSIDEYMTIRNEKVSDLIGVTVNRYKDSHYDGLIID